MKQSLELMRKRHAYFSQLVAKYTSIADFIADNIEHFTIMGVDLSGNEKSASINIDFDLDNYELYTVKRKRDGSLYISDEVLWQNDYYCCNSTINIFTGKEY